MFRLKIGSASVRAVLIAALLVLSLPAASAQPASGLDLSYELSFPEPHTHYYLVSFRVGNVTSATIDLQMPSWTPGSYLMREFARNVQDFEAKGETGVALEWSKTDKSTWRVRANGSAATPRTVIATYRVYANELSVRTSHLDAEHAYLNGASVFMYVRGAVSRPLRVRFTAPRAWRVTTPLGLAPDAEGWYRAADYDILVDSPAEIGRHRLIEFNVLGKPHRIAIWGEANYSEERLKADFTKIVEEGARMFGGLPYDHYTFIVHLQPGIGGGLEHLNSTTCQSTPRAFSSPRAYKRFLGLVSHEYFHLWNVKRIRPLALGPFDYQNENYTRALWVSEGFTDYYGDIQLRRAGLITSRDFLDGLAQAIQTYESAPGRFAQSAESSSFDAWIKQYRPDENSVNSSLTYYLRGQLLGWLLDFEIRTRSGGARTLDDAMRALLRNHGLPKPGFTDAELKRILEEAAGGDLTEFWKKHISGTVDPDFNAYLGRAGVRLVRAYQPGTPYAESKTDRPGTLGIRFSAANTRVSVTAVIAGLSGYRGGLNAGDEIAAVDGYRIDGANASELLNNIRAGQDVKLTIFRRERLMTLELRADAKPFDRYYIENIDEAGPEPVAYRRSWLSLKDGDR